MELAPSKPPVPPSSITERFLTTVAANHISPIPSKAGRKQAGDISENDAGGRAAKYPAPTRLNRSDDVIPRHVTCYII
jgi:hypothetical protein